LPDIHNAMRIEIKKGFTIVEVMVSSSIALYIFLCAWAMYVMGSTWWYEIASQSECQRIVRIAVSVVSEGMTSATYGTDIIGVSPAVSYSRRNGLKGATRVTADPPEPGFMIPTIVGDGHQIDFKLELDPAGTNCRKFFIGQDANGVNALYYQYGITPRHAELRTLLLWQPRAR
jgi:hypothetical protein